MSSVFAALFSVMLSAHVFAQDIGIEGFSHSGSNANPSGSKPQSKLWFHDGIWWGSLWNSSVADFRIHRLDADTQTWVDTGTLIDERKNGRADILWDGTKLNIVSHHYAPFAEPGYPIWFSRFSYDDSVNTYVLDSGFPVQIGDYKVETVVIDKDSIGTIWATWQQDGLVYINHTLGSDELWGVPYQLPVSFLLTDDDISSVIHFNGDRIGVCWGDQITSAYWFSFHLDGDPDTTWSTPESMLAPGSAGEDHINLKTDALGQVYSAVKSDGHVLLLVRRPDASWSQFLACDKSLNFTRPIVEIDQENGELFFVASTSGTTYLKTSPLYNIAFPDGYGTPLMRDAEVLDMDNPTSTKQDVDSTSGLVVLATNQTTQTYWHASIGIQPPEPPVASFSANPTQGAAPLAVHFTDTSAGIPTEWLWDFGDGSISSEENPIHVYEVVGTYTVSLVARNVNGSDTVEVSNLVRVDPPVLSKSFLAVADAHVKSTSPDNNYGTQTSLRVRHSASEEYRPYMKFEVLGLEGQIVGARLRLYVTDGSPDGGSVFAADSMWAENTITWNNAPPISGAALAQAGEVVAGTVVELDLTGAVAGNGTYTFVLTSADSNSAFYVSREDVTPPELVIDYYEKTPVPPKFGRKKMH